MSAYYADDFVTLHLGDCLEIVSEIGVVDHLIADPPYFSEVMSKAVHTPYGRRGHMDKLRRDFGFDCINKDFPAKLWPRLPPIKRWSLVFSDTENAHLWAGAAQCPDHRFVRTMFWHKLCAQPQITGDRPAAHVEAITVCHAKSKSKWNGGGNGNLLSYPIARGASERFDHGTPKPLTLMKKLVSLFTDEGELILDPFGGTGTTAKACKDLKRRCVVIEQDERWCEVIAKRCSQEILL